MDNPFERYDLDPRDGITALTQRLKELAEDATDDDERERIRQAWEELTLHPARRLRAALFAHPETRSALGSPRLAGRVRSSAPPELDLLDLAARPSVRCALGGGSDSPKTSDHDPSSLEDDPVLRGLV